LAIDTSLLQLAAGQACAGQHHPPGALYMVATPIGNLADITLRALHVLGLVDSVACEDTRVTSRLLHHYGLAKPLLALHAHNEAASRIARCAARLAQGQRVAFASDAGTPAISDPGRGLVAAAAIAAGFRVLPTPRRQQRRGRAQRGRRCKAAQDFASSASCPPRAGAATPRCQAARQRPGHRCFSRRRTASARWLEELAAWCPAAGHAVPRADQAVRVVAACRLAELPAWLAADDSRSRGEFVLVLHAADTPAADPGAIDPQALRTLELLLAELPLRQAVGLAAAITGAPRNGLYEEALRRRG
jgi:16S rRNA (cytidine1402-2'-O)-methyltransferase